MKRHAITIISAILSILLLTYVTSSKKVLGPPEELGSITLFHKATTAQKHDIIFLGNSVLRDAINMELFQKITEMKAHKLNQGGSYTTWWYLAIKNYIVKLKNKPKYLAINFRETYLTDPKIFVESVFRKNINTLRNTEEPLVDQLTYGNSQAYIDSLLRKYWVPYGQSFRAKTRFKESIKRLNDKIFSLSPNTTKYAINNLFIAENMNKSFLNKKTELLLPQNSEARKDFKNRCQKSYLPHIIKLCEDAGINLIFVRNKTMKQAAGQLDSDSTREYFSNFRQYIAGFSHVHFFDLSELKEIKLKHFPYDDHINPEGSKILTKDLAHKFLNLINNI